jgi:K+-transporting ATPase ATPase B chain
VIVKAGELIPGDGEIIEGAATVDESAITENLRRSREAGGDRSAVYRRHARSSDEIKIRITSNPGETFLDRDDRFGRRREASENQTKLRSRFCSPRSRSFSLIVLMSLKAYGIYSGVDFFDHGSGRAPGLFDSDHDRWIA